MADELYVDGVLAAGMNRGMLRIDFYSVSPVPGSATEETKLPGQRLVMTPQGFAETYAVFTDIMRKLTEAGLVRPLAPKTGGPDSSGPETHGSGSPAPGEGGVSPNF